MLRIRRDLFHSSDQSREQGSRDDKDDKEKPGASKDQLDESPSSEPMVMKDDNEDSDDEAPVTPSLTDTSNSPTTPSGTPTSSPTFSHCENETSAEEVQRRRRERNSAAVKRCRDKARAEMIRKTEKLQRVENAAEQLQDLFSIIINYIPKDLRGQFQQLLDQLNTPVSVTPLLIEPSSSAASPLTDASISSTSTTPSETPTAKRAKLGPNETSEEVWRRRRDRNNLAVKKCRDKAKADIIRKVRMKIDRQSPKFLGSWLERTYR